MGGNIEREGPGTRIDPRLFWAGGWLAALAIPLWMSRLTAVWLVLGALGAVLWTAGVLRRADWTTGAAALALWATLAITAGVQYRLSQVAGEWPQLQRQIEERAAAELNEALDGLVERGEEAVAGVEAALPPAGERMLARPLFDRLETLRDANGVSALALFGRQGVPLAWSGEHRGAIPLSARLGGQAYVYHEGPLFTYLYFSRPLSGGRTAVASILLESRLETERGQDPFADRFADRFGLTPRFFLPERARGETVWDWSTDRPLLSVSFAALTQQHWWERIVGAGRRAAAAGWVVALVLLSAAWYRRRMGPAGVPVAVATAALVLAPLGEIVGTQTLFSPLHFVLPVPGDLTLGVLLVLLVGMGVWILTRAGDEPPRVEVPLWVQGLLAAVLFPLVVALIGRSATGGLLAGRLAGGLPLQLVTTLALALPLFFLIHRGPRGGASTKLGRLLLGGAAVLAVGLGLALLVGWAPGREMVPWSAALWAVPFVLASAASTHLFPSRSVLRSWVLAGVVAASVALPQLWVLHTSAVLENAERELAGLGTHPDPFLEFLLRQFAEAARAFAAEGEEGVNLLYHGWVESGLAAHGHEANLTIWRNGQPETRLPLSRVDSVHAVVPELVATVRRGSPPAVRRFTDAEALHYLLLSPLPDGRVLSVEVPPRMRIGRATALARFLRPGREAEPQIQTEGLFLVPVEPGAADTLIAGGGTGVQWSRTDRGWRSEARARFPSGWMHAHLFVRTSSIPLAVIRGLLAVAALAAIFVGLWLIARLLCGDHARLPIGRREWVRSFRGRLTVTLFLFFLFPTAVFGAVAYGAVAREVVLSAAAQARRVLEQAAPAVARDRLPQVGSDIGTDLLLYRNGLLVDAAAPEVLDLGLFHSWLPPDVFLDFATAEDTEAQENRRLGENEYLVAYRRLNAAEVLAAPVPLASREITRRQSEFRDIALLVSLLGAGLSVVLSLLAGRALSRPIAELSQAAATVGGGDLRVRLPQRRADEFGGVYRAFNRMVQRLRRARAELAREARRTETIVAEAATGVLALDAEGRVELVNPRAAEIIGSQPEAGRQLPESGPVSAAVIEALRAFQASGALEAGRDLEVDGRMLRLRFRKLPGDEGPRGIVVALEDVTAEVRTARVLAWGEMARQVAHEIKNPLTPIKLSVQHLRRAFSDRRPDFPEILDRNVDAVLEEIDRLGEIARAFARFGTPQQPGLELETVEVPRAVQETLALYRGGGEEGVRFRMEMDPVADLSVTARMGELKEVLVNLLENAREAIEGAGDVVVSARQAEPGWVELDVRDTGEGIAPELLPRVFEPQFSTRTSGSGLGLAIVRRLVESWGGTVEAESRPGSGTRVRLRLRAADGPPPAGGRLPGTPLAPPPGGGTQDPSDLEENMTDLKKGQQRSDGATGGVGQPDGHPGEENAGPEFGTSERATRGTDRDADRSGESANQGHGHPREERGEKRSS